MKILHTLMSASVMVKCPIGKSIFAVKLFLKLFRATIASVVKGSLESPLKFHIKWLYYISVQIKQNRTVQTTRNLELLKTETKNR